MRVPLQKASLGHRSHLSAKRRVWVQSGSKVRMFSDHLLKFLQGVVSFRGDNLIGIYIYIYNMYMDVYIYIYILYIKAK